MNVILIISIYTLFNIYYGKEKSIYLIFLQFIICLVIIIFISITIYNYIKIIFLFLKANKKFELCLYILQNLISYKFDFYKNYICTENGIIQKTSGLNIILSHNNYKEITKMKYKIISDKTNTNIKIVKKLSKKDVDDKILEIIEIKELEKKRNTINKDLDKIDIKYAYIDDKNIEIVYKLSILDLSILKRMENVDYYYTNKYLFVI